MRGAEAFLRAGVPRVREIVGLRSRRSRMLFYPESKGAARLLRDRVSIRRPATTVDPPASAIETARRIQLAYDSAKHDAPAGSSPAGLWGSLIASAYAPLQTALDGSDPRRLAEVLEGMFATEISTGLSMHGELNYLETPSRRGFFLAWWLDGLACLGASLGLLPEEADYGEIPVRAFSTLYAEVAFELGIDLSFPEVCSAWGVAHEGSLLPRSAWRHIHAARTLLDLVPAAAQPRIIEIGGGFGGVALWLHRLAVGNVRYTTYDFPIVNAIAGYFLVRAMPSAEVVLYGEPFRDDQPYLAVLPTWKLAERREAEVTFNQDSLPEMPRGDAQAYLQTFDAITLSAFYSDNQEGAQRWDRHRADSAQLRLPELEDGLQNLRRVSRFRSWMRKGYVETIYRPLSERIDEVARSST